MLEIIGSWSSIVSLILSIASLIISIFVLIKAKDIGTLIRERIHLDDQYKKLKDIRDTMDYEFRYHNRVDKDQMFLIHEIVDNILEITKRKIDPYILKKCKRLNRIEKLEDRNYYVVDDMLSEILRFLENKKQI